jgi:sec-independent protein translocase protein TatB
MAAPLPIQLSIFSMADSLILMVLALVVFGPRRLPQIGRQIGKLMYEFRKASNDFKFQMEEELRLSEEADRRKKQEAERAQVAALPPPTQTIEASANIAAVEQVSVSAPPAAPSEPTHSINLPRTVPVIQPPSTGEQIPAARPNAVVPEATSEQPSDRFDSEGSGGFNPRITQAESPSALAAEGNESAPRVDETLETNLAADPPASTAPPEDPTRSETVSQHG